MALLVDVVMVFILGLPAAGKCHRTVIRKRLDLTFISSSLPRQLNRFQGIQKGHLSEMEFGSRGYTCPRK